MVSTGRSKGAISAIGHGCMPSFTVLGSLKALASKVAQGACKIVGIFSLASLAIIGMCNLQDILPTLLSADTVKLRMEAGSRVTSRVKYRPGENHVGLFDWKRIDDDVIYPASGH